MTDEQLTRLLAEKIMGWKPEEPGGRWMLRNEQPLDPVLLGPSGYPSAWNPLERIEHAFQVWLELRRKGEVRLSAPIQGELVDEGWTAWFQPRSLGHPLGSTMAGWPVEAKHQEPARAISLCALRAVGLDPEGEP